MADFEFKHLDELRDWVNLDGLKVTDNLVRYLLGRHHQHLTVVPHAHPEMGNRRYYALTVERGTNEEWSCEYAGNDRLRLEAAIITWMLGEEYREMGSVRTDLTVWNGEP